MEEVLALAGTTEDFPADCLDHLEVCGSCREFLEDSLQLNRVLREPLPFPPTDLAERVMERIALSEAEEPQLPWAERFAWVVCGAIAMFCVERLPEYSAGWSSSLESLWTQAEWMMDVPFALSASKLVLAGVVLLLVQGALILKTRATVK